jgi:hypothetical protein
MTIDGKCPSGPLAETWDRRRQELKLVSPANKRKYKIIVVGTGLAGASAAATLGDAIRTVLAGDIVSQLREELMQLKTTPMMGIVSSVFSMIRSKEGISGRERQMFIVLHS